MAFWSAKKTRHQSLNEDKYEDKTAKDFRPCGLSADCDVPGRVVLDYRRTARDAQRAQQRRSADDVGLFDAVFPSAAKRRADRHPGLRAVELPLYVQRHELGSNATAKQGHAG